MPGSKIYARGFKNRDTAWVEYLLGFEIIVPVACVYSCAASAPYSMDFARGGQSQSLGVITILWVDMHQSCIFVHSIPAVAEDSTSAVGYLPLELQSNEQDLRRE